MKEPGLWDRFIDWFDFVALKKIGLIRYKRYKAVYEFYNDWLVDIARNEPISEREKRNILKEYHERV